MVVVVVVVVDVVVVVVVVVSVVDPSAAWGLLVLASTMLGS